MVNRSLLAAELLANEGIQVRILEMPCVKPIDVEAVVKCAGDTGAIVTAEEHTIIGGAVAEVLGGTLPTPLIRVGIQDVFTEWGDHNILLDRYRMAITDLVSAAQKAVQMKK